MTPRSFRSSRARRPLVSALAVALTAAFTLSATGIAQAIEPTHTGVVRAAAAAAQDPGTFVSLEPARILDTRVGNGASKAQVDAYGTVALEVAGRGGVPASGVAAVVVNVTVTSPQAAGFITVYPSGTTAPTASNLNFGAGETIPNLVTVKVGADGRINLTNYSAGKADLIADVAGYYLAGTPTVPGAFVSLDPARVLDTRVGNGAPKNPVTPSASAEVQVTGRAGVPESGVIAVVVNVTVTNARAAGFVTVFPSGGQMPTASNLNFRTGQNIPNLVTVRVGTGGKISLANNSANTVDLIADVAGYYLAGTATAPGSFVSLDPSRVLDTRIGQGAGQYPVDSEYGVSLQVTDRASVPRQSVAAVVMNVTVTNPSTPGFITVFPNGADEPTASNLNFSAGQNIPNLAIVKVGGNGTVNFSNNSPGTVDLIADVAGYFNADPAVKDQVWVTGWSFDDCGVDYDGFLLLASPGIIYSPSGALVFIEGRYYYDFYPDANGSLVLNVSAEPGFELVNTDPDSFTTNPDGTLTGDFTFSTDPCFAARNAAPQDASENGSASRLPSEGSPFGQPVPLGTNE